MVQEPTCPLCETDLKRCSGAPDMPASQEYWQCRRCGLSTHVSWLMSPEGRRKIRDNHVAELKRRVEDGREAFGQLKAARKPCCSTSTSRFRLHLASQPPQRVHCHKASKSFGVNSSLLSSSATAACSKPCAEYRLNLYRMSIGHCRENLELCI